MESLKLTHSMRLASPEKKQREAHTANYYPSFKCMSMPFPGSALQLSFTCFAYPCLVLTYLGQTAVILEHPEAAAAAYWESLPHPVKWPMV